MAALFHLLRLVSVLSWSTDCLKLASYSPRLLVLPTYLFSPAKLYCPHACALFQSDTGWLGLSMGDLSIWNGPLHPWLGGCGVSGIGSLFLVASSGLGCWIKGRQVEATLVEIKTAASAASATPTLTWKPLLSCSDQTLHSLHHTKEHSAFVGDKHSVRLRLLRSCYVQLQNAEFQGWDTSMFLFAQLGFNS